MMRYYLLFLFLVERKKYVAVEQKIMEKKKTARARALQIKQVNRYISMVIYSQLFLFLLKRKIMLCYKTKNHRGQK